MEVRGRGLGLGPPKSRAGLRVVSLPAAVLPAIRVHMAEFVGSDEDALLFTTEAAGPSGGATSTSW